jgi:hypothetical protein
MTPMGIQLPTRRQEALSETHEASDGQTFGRRATQDTSISIVAPSRKKKSKRAAKRDKRDSRQHEHLITDRENRLETTLGVNLVKAASMEAPNQSATADSDIPVKSESRPIALEIGEVDEELEHAQIVL